MQSTKCACESASFFCFANKVVADFLNGSTYLQSVPTKNNKSPKTALLKSVLTTAEAFLLFYGVAHVIENMADARFHGKMKWKTGCCTGTPVQIVTRV